jgi:hypothetical protein
MKSNEHLKSKSDDSNNQDLGFTWWYVWSWLNLGLGVPLVFLKMLDMRWGFVSVILALAYGAICISMLAYNRYAFVAATVLSINPLVWIINGVYVKNRWMHPKVISGSMKQKTGSDKNKKVPSTLEDLLSRTSLIMNKVNVPSNSDYVRVSDEIALGKIDEGLWTRFFVETDGDEKRTLARYIKARAVSIAEAASVTQLTSDTLAPFPNDREIICLPASSLELQRDVEQGYLNKLYGGASGWTLISQQTIDGNERVFDKVEITVSDGRVKTIWFDITQAWNNRNKTT